MYILGLTFQLPVTPPRQYLTLLLRGHGFDTFQTNLLAVPYTALHGTFPHVGRVNLTPSVATMLIITYLAEVFGELTFTAMTGQIWTLPFLVYLTVVDTSQANKWVVWAVISLLLGAPYGMSSLHGSRISC